MPEPILIVGCSARAAAASASRAGFTPSIIDQFCDWDTRQLALASLATNYPDALPEQSRTWPPMPFVYLGGLENHPDIVTAIAQHRHLLGNNADVLRRIRDPFALQDCLNRGGFQMAEARATWPDFKVQERWLLKPYRSGGGLGIRFLAASDRRLSLDGHYFQKYTPGVSQSALFFSAAGRCQLLGITEQLIGPDPLLSPGVPPFAYCGNIGPITDTPAEQLSQLGEWLTEQTGLLGVWGVDYILTAAGPVVIEVNPRYTAAVEVLERATGGNAFQLYRQAFFDGPAVNWQQSIDEVAAKLIVYAPQDMHFPMHGPWYEAPSQRWPRWADIPEPGQIIYAGQPILTILEVGSLRTIRTQLLTRRGEFFALLQSPDQGALS